MAASELRVLGLECSPRKGGNTDLMLDSALQGARERGAFIEKIDVPSLDINPCKACNGCFKTGECIQQDAMQELYPKLISWEGIILSAPIFSMNLAAQAKVMIDRVQCLWARKYVLKQHTVADDVRDVRRGLWLSAAGMDKPKLFEPARVTVKYFFAMLEIREWESITVNNVDAKGAIRQVPRALDRCRDAGRQLVAV